MRPLTARPSHISAAAHSRAALASGLFAILALAQPVRAEEGMWPLNLVQPARVKEAVGVDIDAAWLARARAGAVRVGNGCSGSLVSGDGLVLTNQHCVRSCLAQLGGTNRDAAREGFVAQARKDEAACPGFDVSRLTAIEDVTARVKQAVEGKEGEAFAQAAKAIKAEISAQCAGGDANRRCDVVELYQGGRYDLYSYERVPDVRMVFAAEDAAGHFGGVPDNFNFPRYAFDVALLRLYKDGQPYKTEDYFPIAKELPARGGVSFVIGHPGRTSRLFSTAQLEFQRDVDLPHLIAWAAEMRGYLAAMSERAPFARNALLARLRSVENVLKRERGRQQALADETFMRGRESAEAGFRARAENDAATAEQLRTAHTLIDQALTRYHQIFERYHLLEGTRGPRAELFDLATHLVRWGAEQGKPNAERLPDYTDAAFPRIRQQILDDFPFVAERERTLLTFGLNRVLESLGADDPLVKTLFASKAPAQLAADTVAQTRLGDARLRKQLLEGGTAAIEASQDPLIVLARQMDEERRKVRAVYDNEVRGVLERAGALMAQVRLQVDSTAGYPDATGTLRLSFGRIEGWQENERVAVPATTDVAGLYARATGYEPFALAPRWVKAKEKLPGEAPMNLVTTNDIIGGNSGSPLVDQNLRVIGLVFDGNIHSLGGEYGFDAKRNRAVSVAGPLIPLALRHVYGLTALADELERAATAKALPVAAAPSAPSAPSPAAPQAPSSPSATAPAP